MFSRMCGEFCPVRRLRLRGLAISLFVFGLLQGNPAAKAQSAALTGMVMDPSGAMVPSAKVTLTNTDTNTPLESTTNKDGLYSLPYVKPGTYTLTVEAEGFARYEQTGVAVGTAQNLALNIRLKLGSSTQSVNVQGGTEMANTVNDSPAVGLTISREFVENAPLNGRSFQDLIQLTPGTVSTENGYYSINGQRTDANNYMVDGISANLGGINNSSQLYSSGAGLAGASPSQTALGTTQSLASIDALQEFTIQTSGYTAEYGRNVGGQVQFTTRSGTNTIHGSLFDYLRNTAFDANTYYNNFYNLPQAPEHQNDFGGTIGGALIIPKLYNGTGKTFYFFSYEGLRLLLPAFESDYVPTQAFRDWAYPGVKPFIDVAPLPSPNSPDNDDGCTVPDSKTGQQMACDARFNYSYSNANNLDNIGLRLDHNFGNRFHAFARVAYTPSSARNGSWSVGTSATNIRTFTGGLTASITNNLLDDLRVNYSYDREYSHSVLTNIGGATPLPRNLLIPSQYDDPNAQGFGDVLIPGTGVSWYFSFGGGGATTQKQYQVVDSVSWSHGAHLIKTGVDWRRLTPTNTSIPYFSYVGFQSRDAIQTGTATWMEAGRVRPGKPVLNNLSLYVQDHWKVGPRFSLDYGLRWEFNPPPGPSNGVYPVTITTDDLSNATIAPTGTRPFTTNYHSFAPRLGFAWNALASQKHPLTVRAGFGIFFDAGQSPAAAAFGGTSIYGSYGANYPFLAERTIDNVPYSEIANGLNPPSLDVPLVPPYSYLSVTDPRLTAPYSEQWNLSIDEKLTSQDTLTVSYVGNNGRKLLYTQFYETIPGNSDITDLNYTSNGSQSSYAALQIQNTGRLRKGLDLVASFTWAHSLDNVSSAFITGAPRWGSSDYDLRRVLNLALNYQTPTIDGNRWVRQASRGWLLANRFSTQSGYPFNVTQATVTLAGGYSAAYTPDLVPGVPVYLHGSAADFKGKPVPGNWRVNREAFANVPVDSDGNPTRQGSLGRNYLRNPAFFALNTAVQREFPIYERLQLDFRAEAFNLFNHPNLDNPDSTLANTTFGQLVSGGITTIGSSNALYSMGASRSLQFSLHLKF